jgi:hypothetical protein
MQHVGYRMLLALSVIANCPAPSKHALAIAVGPHGSSKYGYEIVKRLVDSGLARIDPTHLDAVPSGEGAVVITAEGLEVLEENK